MGKFLKSGKVVILLNGRYAGRKAIIVRVFDEGTKGRQFPHALVVGIDRYPRNVTKTMSKKKILKRSKIVPFVKYVNLQHVMPTRYSSDLDIKSFVTQATMKTSEKRHTSKVDVKKVLEEKYFAGTTPGTGNAWFYKKLRF